MLISFFTQVYLKRIDELDGQTIVTKFDEYDEFVSVVSKKSFCRVVDAFLGWKKGFKAVRVRDERGRDVRDFLETMHSMPKKAHLADAVSTKLEMA
jgi:hypothetical protein